MTGPIYNEDCTDFFYFHPIHAGVDGAALLEAYVDTLAGAGIKVMMCNTNARRTNYRSAAWESFWDGYDPKGPDDQPFFRAVGDETTVWRRLIHSMWALDDQGVDYPRRVSELCRARGISPWISLRMNDVHFNDNLDHPFHGKLWRDPRYFRNGEGYHARELDYAHPEVRDLYRALIVETLDRYDVDGLELDFMRECYLFRPGAEAEGGRILTEWLRDIRRLVSDAAARRGHPVRLGVRVPSRVEVAKGWGLDAVAWAREGLIDLVVPTPRWATLEYDMPMDQWREQLAGTGVTLAGGLETLHRPAMASPYRSVTPEHAVGAATAVLAGGADAVYLFNYFPSMIGGRWDRAIYQKTLAAMASLEALAPLPRRHAITWRDVEGPGEDYHPPLPADGTLLSLSLFTGPAPQAGSASVEITLAAPADPPAVTVNGTPATHAATTSDETPVLRYDLPLSALAAPRAAVEITAPQPIRVMALEIRIVPR